MHNPFVHSKSSLRTVSNFRSRGRFPVLSWKSPDSNVALFRCAQPNVSMRESIPLDKRVLISYVCGSIAFLLFSRPVLQLLGARKMKRMYSVSVSINVV